MTKLSTVQILIELLDVMQESKTVAEVKQPEEVIEFLQKNLKSIAQKQKAKKAEKEKAIEMKQIRTTQRKATNEQKANRIEAIKQYLQNNPNEIVSAKILCEKVFKNEIKSQALTRIIIDLEKDGFIKVVAVKPSKQFQLK